MPIYPATIEIADISSVGKSYFFTDVPTSILLPSKTKVTATLLVTIDDINSSEQIKTALLAKDIIFIINGFLEFDQFPIPSQIFTEQEQAVNSTNLDNFNEEIAAQQAAAAAPPATVVIPSDVPDATAAIKGILRLGKDLAGTADNPELINVGVVPGIYTNATITVDAKGRVLMAASGIGGGGETIVWNETPSGVVDGVNDTFLLAFPPDVPNDIILTKNGIVQKPGAGNDYVLSGVVIVFEPGNIPFLGDILLATYQSDAATLTPEAHRSLRHLIHFLNDGPGRGFPSGSFKETLPAASPFPTSVIWWTSAAKTAKTFERLIAYTGPFPTSIIYNMYAVDGVTIVETATDAISYSGPFETSRTRTIT